MPDLPATSRMAKAVGIDLAGSAKRDTGFCVMDARMLCHTSVLHTDDEIFTVTVSATPDVVSIDAPLFLPKGRVSLDTRGPPHFRECDLELRRMKIRFFPISLGPMRMLTARGMRLRARLEEDGIEVIESFPGAIQDILGIPRKQVGLKELELGLQSQGVRWGDPMATRSGDELDAATSALVGMLYLKKEYRAIGDPSEGLMILPRSMP